MPSDQHNASSVKLRADASAMDDDWDQLYIDSGYAWCRTCAEWHRPPECAICGSCGSSTLDCEIGQLCCPTPTPRLLPQQEKETS